MKQNHCSMMMIWGGNMGTKYEFERSKQDIADAVLRQAGDINKGFIEAIQNSYDAMIKKPKSNPIEIEVLDDETILIKDSGKGFDNIEDFRLFGRDDNKGVGKGKEELGEFHIGRGQIFAMASVKEDNSRDIVFYTKLKRKKIKIHNIKLLSDDVSFEVDYVNHEYDGTAIVIKNEKFDYYEILEYLTKTLKFFPRRITLNGKTITENPTLENTKTKWILDTEYAKIYFTNASGGFSLYNLGLFVNREDMGEGFRGYIFTKTNLKLDRARTSVMYDDKRYDSIKKEIKWKCVMKTLILPRPTHSQKSGMLRMSGKNTQIAEVTRDKKIIPLANGKWITPRELEHLDMVYISNGKNKSTEDDAIQSGYVVLENNYNVTEYCERKDIEMKDFNYCPIKQSEHKQLCETTYTKTEKEVLSEMLYFCKERKLTMGLNNSANGWTDGANYITINRKRYDFEQWNNGGKFQFVWKFVELIAHELSHDVTNALTNEHGEEFDKLNLEHLERLGVKYSKWVARQIKKQIKEESGEKFTTRIIRNKDSEGNLIVKIQIPKDMENKHKLLKKKEVELSLLGSLKY